jgi:hypothetical protein
MLWGAGLYTYTPLLLLVSAGVAIVPTVLIWTLSRPRTADLQSFFRGKSRGEGGNQCLNFRFRKP